MPRVIRRAKKRSSGYGDEHVHHLLYGVAICPGHAFRTSGHESDIEAMQVAWNILRDQLMSVWIARFPGSRPYCWWKFDAPEPRKRTDDVQHPFANRVRKARVEKMAAKNPSFWETAYELFYGKPRALVVRDDFEAQYESEETYLRRLDLLTDAEKELLAS